MDQKKLLKMKVLFNLYLLKRKMMKKMKVVVSFIDVYKLKTDIKFDIKS